MKQLGLALFALALGGCVTVNEPLLTPVSAAAGQRTILTVYPGPGTWVISESESKAEAAAKSMPLFSTVVESMQDERDRKMSEQLAPYIPRWKPAEIFEPLLRAELLRTRFPGRFVPAAETELDSATVRGLNRAANALEWQKKYFYGDPSLPLPRDYSRFMALDDALIYEANLLVYVAANDNGDMVPSLGLSSRLIRCQTNHLLWKHEDRVSDPAAAKSLNEFATLPEQLMDRWKALLPTLAAQAAASLNAALGVSSSSYGGAPVLPAPGAWPTVSTGTVTEAPPASAPQPAAPASLVPALSTAPASGGVLPPATSTAPITDGPPAAPPPPVSADGPPANTP
jgi:hypothetical protein